ncbi:MAG: nucleotidyltransferase family protein [Acidimicrobiales bacterium]
MVRPCQHYDPNRRPVLRQTPQQMMTSLAGPLQDIGPAARWCLTAGIIEPPPETPSVDAFREESQLILSEGLAPVALHAFATGQPWQDDPVAVAFHDATMMSQFRSMAVDVEGAILLSAFARAGIPYVVIKGPAIARLHPAGWPRPYSDIDIVVPRRNFIDAIMGSHKGGFEYSERSVPQWRWFDLVCREGLNLHSPAGGNIDIHHHIPPWALASKLTARDLIERSIPWKLCGKEVRIAANEDLLLISALHVLNDLWKGKLGLASWRDVIVLMTALGTEASERAFDHAELAWLFELATTALSVTVPEAGFTASAHDSKLPPATRLRVAAMGWGNDSALSRHRLAWATRLPAPNALAFLAGSAFPAPSYIRERHGSLWGYWKGGWDETVSTVQGSDYRMITIADKDTDAS